jgi:Putative Flp pilus-assembly TadE/G-like
MSGSYQTRVVERSCARRWPRCGSPRADHQRGYIAVVTAIVMTLLLIVVGLAVDVAMWYQRSSQIQRATDAASLAGVTAGPTLANEIEVARQSLQRNGFVDGVNGVSTVIAPQPGYPNRLQVQVSDSKVSGFFSRMFTTPPKLVRSSTSEYVKSISLGSAYNALGTGDQLDHIPGDPASQQGFWLSVSGYCTAKEDGDRLLAHADGTRERASFEYACDETTPGNPDAPNGFANSHRNADYDPAGYAYIVSIPCPTVPAGETCPLTTTIPADISIEAFDPAYSPNLGDDPTDDRIDRKAVANSQHWAWNDSEVTTTFQIFKPDNTPEDTTDDIALPVLGDIRGHAFLTCETAADDLVNNNPCSQYVSKWVNLVTIPAGSPAGNYRVQVHTESNEQQGYGHNSFGLRARYGPNWFACSTIPATAGYSPDCPSVAGEESMSVYANKNGSTSDMFLAKLSPASQYRGKRVRILLWDPGEGAKSIQILSPGSLTPVQFRYRTWDPGLTKVTDGSVIEDRAEGWNTRLTTDTLDVSAITPVSGNYLGVQYPVWNLTSRYSSSKYNDRMVAIEITVPKSYGRDASGAPIALPDDGWWKIRYNTDAAQVQDRTTWSVTLAGDPVHLIDEKAP